jgi:hypothetical protein
MANHSLGHPSSAGTRYGSKVTAVERDDGLAECREYSFSSKSAIRYIQLACLSRNESRQCIWLSGGFSLELGGSSPGVLDSSPDRSGCKLISSSERTAGGRQTAGSERSES